MIPLCYIRYLVSCLIVFSTWVSDNQMFILVELLFSICLVLFFYLLSTQTKRVFVQIFNLSSHDLFIRRVSTSPSTMLFLRVPYGEEKLFALVSPAQSSWGRRGLTNFNESSGAESRLHKKSPAARASQPQDAQASSHNKVVVPEKSNHINAVSSSSSLQIPDDHTAPDTQKTKEPTPALNTLVELKTSLDRRR